MFELLEGGEVLQVPTDTPMDEKAAWLAFRDVLLGMEYRELNKAEIEVGWTSQYLNLRRLTAAYVHAAIDFNGSSTS